VVFQPLTESTDEIVFQTATTRADVCFIAAVDENRLPRRLEPHAQRSTFMRKTNCLPLLLAAAAMAVMPLIAVSARAGVGDIYETNDGMILRFLPTGGTPSTFASNLSNPKGLALDGNGHVFVADADGGVIIRYNTIDGQGGITFASGLSSPVGLTFDVLGNLFESDAGSGAIFKFSTVDGTRTTFATGLSGPAGLAFDRNGNLFVADFAGGAIYKFTSDGTKTTFASGLSFPAGLAIDSSNNVFEADSGSGTIFKFTPDGIKTAFATGLSSPYGLAFEASGNLVEADKDSGSTFRFTPTGDRSTIFSSDFNTPQFVAVEPAPHRFLNISTRGFVQGGDHILIAGFIVGGSGPVGTTVALRAIGPSLSTAGILDPLPDPVLEVRDASGTLVGFNDNWADAPPAQLIGFNFQPTDSHESALQLVLHGGAFTAIVSGAGGLVGTALVEVYDLQ
jgi:sugar lactone lactonase YvrE